MLCGLSLYRLKNKGQWNVDAYVKRNCKEIYSGGEYWTKNSFLHLFSMSNTYFTSMTILNNFLFI